MANVAADSPYEMQRSDADYQYQVWRVVNGRRRLEKTFPGVEVEAKERAEAYCKQMNAGCGLGAE